MKVYRVVNKDGTSKGVYHESMNAAILYFMLDGNKGIYSGSALTDWENFKMAGWKVQGYTLEEF